MLDAGRTTLDEFARDEWAPRYAIPNLSLKTRTVYGGVWDRYVGPRLGGIELRRLTPQVIDSFVTEMRAAGVGDPTIVKSLTALQSVLSRAVMWGWIASNPATAVRKPSQRRSRAVRPLPPSAVEAIRSRLDPRDATLISVLAYAGLRPGEALALRWRDVRERTILVERAVSLGEVKDTKTRSTRSVRLLGPLAADLAEWRMRSGRPRRSRSTRTGTCSTSSTAPGDCPRSG